MTRNYRSIKTEESKDCVLINRKYCVDKKWQYFCSNIYKSLNKEGSIQKGIIECINIK